LCSSEDDLFGISDVFHRTWSYEQALTEGWMALRTARQLSSVVRTVHCSGAGLSWALRRALVKRMVTSPVVTSAVRNTREDLGS
jgi:hypothetical protein